VSADSSVTDPWEACLSDLLEGVTWFRGSSVRIEREGLVIFVDPAGVPRAGEADYVLLTHPHYDNFSEDDIERVRSRRTVVVAPASMKKQMEQADHFMRPGDMIQLEGIDVLAVPAYNKEKKFHPQKNAWLGYVFTVGGVTYYHAGDTDYLESMSHIRCDIAFLPCQGSYTMGPDEAARAAKECGAKVVVPVHWGETASSKANVSRLAALAPSQVRILEPSA
jgi:L-ascorbate metabolism protein UlaG (beta-lactamase superfamily)